MKQRLLITAITTALCVAAAAAAAATAPKLPDMPDSYLFTQPGKVTPLRNQITYGASRFPIALRLTPPEAGWSGAQWKGGSDYFAGGGPPNFGWVALARGAPTGIPRGLVTIMTAYARTPSVAKTVEVLRTRGRGATYQATSHVELAGFAGIQFDGQIVGAKSPDHVGHFFVPFSPPSNAAKYYPDEYPVYGDVFRVIVLDVRGKTVVVYLENVALPPDRFPAFLAKAEALLTSLGFPADAKGA
jgi:hypothetical protein